MNSIVRAGFSLLSPAGAGARLSILIFHRVLPARDAIFPGEIVRTEFDNVCGWLRRWFNVLPLSIAARQLRENTLPSRALAITFDDGYADNHDVALPVLKSHALPATFFIASGFLDGGRMWNDTVIEAVRRSAVQALDLRDTVAATLGVLPLDTLALRQTAIRRIITAIKYLPQAQRDGWCAAVARRAGAALPDDLMMSSAQVRTLHRDGMEIGAHTVSHPILARLDTAAATNEISQGRQALEQIIGQRVNTFAYPNGRPGEDYGSDAVAVVRDLGFDAAVSTAWGAASAGDDSFQLPRFTPWDRTQLRFGLRLARNLHAS